MNTRLYCSLCNFVLFIGLLAITADTANSQTVIQRDGNGDLNYDNNASFGSSGLTLDVRRFATIPNNSNGSFARLNSLTYAPGIDGVFVVNAGQFGAADSQAPIYRVSADGSSVTPFFDPSDTLDLPRNTFALNQQGGVRSLAFHPDFNKQGTAGYGKLYTSQLVRRPTDVSGLNYLGPNLSGQAPSIADSVVAEWKATFSASGELTGVDSGSYREVFRVATPASGSTSGQHPVKQIAFNRHATAGSSDYGNLYVLHGDGSESATEGTGQIGSNALGKVLRINPIQNGSNSYSIPDDNPFNGNSSVLDEVYTLGHRNVHTIAFAKDSGGETRIFVTEVGHASVEEVNMLDAGRNYGWGPESGGFFEGTFLRDGGFVRQGSDPLPQDTDVSDYEFPVAQFGHNTPDGSSEPSLQSGGVAIAGGFGIDNGSELDGHYFLTDFSIGENPVWTFNIDDAVNAVTTGNTNDLAPTELLTVDILFDHDDNPLTASIALDGPDGDGATLLDIIRYDIGDLESQNLSRTDIRFGQGSKGELYIMNKRNGNIYLVSNSIAASVPEPGSAILLFIGASCLVMRRRR